VVTMVWVVSRSRLKAPPGNSSPCISPLTPSGQRNCASWTSQPQKSVTLPPQPRGVTTKVRINMWWYLKKSFIGLARLGSVSVHSEHTTPLKECSHAGLRYLSLESLARADSTSTNIFWPIIFYCTASFGVNLPTFRRNV